MSCCLSNDNTLCTLSCISIYHSQVLKEKANISAHVAHIAVLVMDKAA